MHAGKRIFGKDGFTDFSHFFQCHIHMTGVLNGLNLFVVYKICPNLAKKYAVPANIGFGSVFSNAAGNKCWINRSLYKNVFDFFLLTHNSNDLMRQVPERHLSSYKHCQMNFVSKI